MKRNILTVLRRMALLSIIAIFTIAHPQTASAQKRETAFGVELGYTSKNNSAVTGIFLQCPITEMLTFAPSVGCVFRHQNLDAFKVDVDMHFPFRFLPANMSLYPLAGLDYASWSRYKIQVEGEKDVSTRTSRIGLNMGAGYQYKITNTMLIKVEAKYTLTKTYSTCTTVVGLAYAF